MINVDEFIDKLEAYKVYAAEKIEHLDSIMLLDLDTIPREAELQADYLFWLMNTIGIMPLSREPYEIQRPVPFEEWLEHNW